MSTETDIEPEYPDTQVYLGDNPNDLVVIERVVAELRRTGHPMIADAFALAARDTLTMSELMLLVRCTVSVI